MEVIQTIQMFKQDWFIVLRYQLIAELLRNILSPVKISHLRLLCNGGESRVRPLMQMTEPDFLSMKC